MVPHLQKLIDNWQDGFGQKATFQDILERPVVEAVATLLKIISEETDPRLKLRTIADWCHWLKAMRPDLFRDLTFASIGGTSVSATPQQAHAEALEKRVHMNDVIQLRALDQESRAKLDRWGTWWRIIKGYDYDRSKPAPVTPTCTRPPSWFLKSLTRKEQGLTAMPGDKKMPNEMMWLCKEGDLHFCIVNICVFPKEFKPKEWAGVTDQIKS